MTETKPVDAAGAAGLAAEAVRALNHLTFTSAGYTWPADVDRALRSLQSLAERLPQALDQAGRWLQEEAGKGRVTRDDMGREDPSQGAVAASQIALAIRGAQSAAGLLAGALADACSVTNHLRGVDKEPRPPIRAVEYTAAEED